MARYFIKRRRVALFFLFFATIIVMMISVKIWVEPPVRKTVPLRAGLNTKVPDGLVSTHRAFL